MKKYAHGRNKWQKTIKNLLQIEWTFSPALTHRTSITSILYILNFSMKWTRILGICNVSCVSYGSDGSPSYPLDCVDCHVSRIDGIRFFPLVTNANTSPFAQFFFRFSMHCGDRGERTNMCGGYIRCTACPTSPPLLALVLGIM